ncbi:hypothetical protein GWI33_014886 [Rhynchophorus ferrugineus]|uniref:C2H2-type domain-containing protein n=1 Tax=Rhynchophorus ferrugineus TaxID=354439 RepID=A0A834IEC7_RHYFE|nr:hypothetical protein GWI33_014886 [Rhynchophorus ferrugineus]
MRLQVQTFRLLEVPFELEEARGREAPTDTALSGFDPRPVQKSGKFECDNCGKSYNYKGSLQRHVRVECGKKKNQACTYCDKKFFYKQELQLRLSELRQTVQTSSVPIQSHYVRMRQSEKLRMSPRRLLVQDEEERQPEKSPGMHDDDRNADMLGDDGAVIKRSKLTHTARHEPSDNMVLSLRDLVNTNAIVDFGQQSDDGHSLSRDPIFEISQIESMMEGESMDDDAPFEHEIFCSLCHTVFSHASSLRYHMKHRVCLKPKKEDMEPKILQCQKCEKVFATGSGYKYHVRRSVCEQEEEKDEPKSLQCQLCDKIFTTSSGYNYHVKHKVCESNEEEKEEEVIQCDKCNTTFRHKTSLQYHITHKVCLKPKKDEEPKSLQCEQCEKIFSTTTALNYHVKNQVCAPKEPKEPKEEEKICTLCNAVFKHSTSLRYHLKHKVCLKPKKEETEPRVLQCLLCEKIFTSNSSLEYHVKRRVCEQQKVALQGPPYLCDICNCSFELRQTWYAHIKRQVCKKYPERYMQEGDFETSVKIEME